jgi:hypothetical protein
MDNRHRYKEIISSMFLGENARYEAEWSNRRFLIDQYGTNVTCWNPWAQMSAWGRSDDKFRVVVFSSKNDIVIAEGENASEAWANAAKRILFNDPDLPQPVKPRNVSNSNPFDVLESSATNR